MDCRGLAERGKHCSRRLLVVALLAWAVPGGTQTADAPEAPQAKPAAASPPTSPPRDAPRLHLYLGDARDLLSEKEWDALASAQGPDLEDPATQSTEVVEVKGERETQSVPMGIASVFWAIRHPTQAWRILAPVPP